MTPPDPHRLHAEDLPTPFTAAEIRDACQPGRELRLSVERPGEASVVHVMRYVDADPEGSISEAWDETPSGERLAEPESKRETWLELQEHASFLAATTVVREETIEILGGVHACLRYTVTDGGTRRTFWFARDLPGPPIRWEVRTADALVVAVTAIANHPAG